MSFRVHIVSAEREIFSGETDLLVATAINGEVGVRERHAPMLAFLKPGQIRLSKDNSDNEQVFYISGGFLEVQPKQVTVLSDTALRAEDLDEAEALKAEERARQELFDKESEVEYSEVLSRLTTAAAQLEVLKRLRKKGVNT